LFDFNEKIDFCISIVLFSFFPLRLPLDLGVLILDEKCLAGAVRSLLPTLRLEVQVTGSCFPHQGLTVSSIDF
jgi:hypothetical protein